MKTLYINLFAGPGTGKSTTATYVFSVLKSLGYNAEYVSEYAKDKVWSEDFKTLKIQPYITGKQFYKTVRLDQSVNIVITDSPFILGIAYQNAFTDKYWEKHLVYQHKKLENISIFLKRNNESHPYNPKGRSQTLNEAIEKDNEVLDILKKFKIDYVEVEVQEPKVELTSDKLVSFTNPTGNEIVSMILARIK